MSTIINYLDKADASTTVALNFDGGSIMDCMSEVFSSRLLWVPIALVFLYFLFKADAKNRQRVLIILAVALTVTLCDQLTSHVMKPYFARRIRRAWRICSITSTDIEAVSTVSAPVMRPTRSAWQPS